jgi:hypothetical protein
VDMTRFHLVFREGGISRVESDVESDLKRLESDFR